MPGEGKYTDYTPKPSPFDKGDGKGVSDRNTLSTLFKSPIVDRATTVKTANSVIFPKVQTGNSDFPQGVALDFGQTPKISAGPFFAGMKSVGGSKDLSDVVGGSANAYVPNLTSPDPSGVGNTNPVTPTVITPVELEKVIELDPSDTAGEISGATAGISPLGTSLLPGKHPGST